MNPDVPARQILVITGAGASTRLGSGERPLPMMSGWAESIASDFGAHSANVLDLNTASTGADIEDRIGAFLQFRTRLTSLLPFARLGSVPSGPGEVIDFGEWHRRATENVEGLMTALWTNLHRNFGSSRVDRVAATRAYSRLHTQLRSHDGGRGQSYIMHATTNFDHAIEIAIDGVAAEDDRVSLLDGFARRPSSDLWAPNLYSASRRNSTGQIPVLHLHGAVGWYLDESEGIRRHRADEAFDPRYVPALLLPDRNKDPEQFPKPIRQVWDEFTGLLQEATHVLFLGHGLNDRHLVRAVRESARPTAVVLHDKSVSDANAMATRVVEVNELLPGAAVIPGEFGSDRELPLDDDQLLDWLRPRAA